jgi:hypothetical protein
MRRDVHPGYRIPDSESQILIPRSRIPDPGWDPESRVPDPVSRIRISNTVFKAREYLQNSKYTKIRASRTPGYK